MTDIYGATTSSGRVEAQVTMVNIVIVSHGNLGEALLRAGEMIAGPQERVHVVQIAPGESPGLFSQRLAAVLHKIEPEPAIILVDLLGGTPYNTAAVHAAKGTVECVTGANLPVLLDLIMSRSELGLSELAESVAQAGRDSIKNVGPFLRGGESSTAR